MTDVAKTLRATAFATRAHEGQTRKWTGEPYIVHPLAVAQYVAEFYETDGDDVNGDYICAALLHDVLEDTDTTLAAIERQFGTGVSMLVSEVTKPATLGNRAERKAAELDKLANISQPAIIIKLGDMLSNCPSIAVNDPEFWPTYKVEKLAILDAWLRRVNLGSFVEREIRSAARQILEIRVSEP